MTKMEQLEAKIKKAKEDIERYEENIKVCRKAIKAYEDELKIVAFDELKAYIKEYGLTPTKAIELLEDLRKGNDNGTEV